MLSPVVSPFRQSRANRKTSTPFLPGAWPSSSGSEEPNSFREDVVSPRNDAYSSHGFDLVEKSSTTLPHLDHVMKFHRRISDSLSANGQQLAGGFQDTESPRFKAESDLPQPRVSDPSSMRDAHHKMSLLPLPRSKVLSKRSRTANTRESSTSIEHTRRSVIDPTHDPHSVFAGSAPSRVHARPVSIDSVLPSSGRGIPPLNLTYSSLFLPQSDFSNLSSPIYPSSPDADSPPAPPSISSVSPSAESITSQHGLLQSPSGIASTFYPLLDHPPTKRYGLPTPSTSASSYGFSTDSPVLPSDEQRNTAHDPQYLRESENVNLLLTPSSADMDVFGIAASQGFQSPSQSALSLPTSFQSASSDESISHSGYISADETTRAQLKRESAISYQSAISTPSSMGSALGDFPTPVAFNHDEAAARAQRSAAPSPSSHSEVSPPHPDLQTFGTPPSHIERMNGAALRPGTFGPFGKVKKLGGRIKKFLKEKFVINEAKDDCVEMIIERPSDTPFSKAAMIPTITSKGPKPKVHIAVEPHPTKQRRQSMPVKSGSSPNVSRPRPLRPTSFLPIEEATERSASYPVSMPNLVAFTPPRPPRRRASQGSPRARVHARSPESTSGDLTGGSKQIDGKDGSRRSRTQTAPPPRQNNQSNKISRRFSLTAALSRSALETLRTTIVPHPALPKVPPSNLYDDLIHRRSASTSANDAWNAAKYGDSPRAPSQRERKPRPLSVVPGVEEGNENGDSPDCENARRGHEMEGVTKEKLELRSAHAISTRQISAIAHPVGRPRSHTHSFGQIRPPSHLVQPNAWDTMNQRQQSKRRPRGFSLTSVISKRALRARSMIVGRSPELDLLPKSLDNPDDTKERGLVTSVSGVSFSMVTPPLSQPQMATERMTTPDAEEHTTSGCADYDPDLILDKMCFAETTEVRSMIGSQTDLSLSGGSISDVAVHSVVLPRSPQLSTNTGLSHSADVTQDEDVEVDPVPGDDREDEREFMRALGLQFDEIVRRARDEPKKVET